MHGNFVYASDLKVHVHDHACILMAPHGFELFYMASVEGLLEGSWLDPRPGCVPTGRAPALVAGAGITNANTSRWSRRHSMAGAPTCSDHCSLVRSRFEPRSVTLEPPGSGGGPARRDLAVVAGTGRTNAKTRDWSRQQLVQGGITDSVCKNQLVVVRVQYGPFNPYILIRSTTIGKSRVAKDSIAMHTSWRSNSDIASVTRSTTIGKSRVAKDSIAMHTSWRSNSDIASVTRASMTFRVVRTNQYNQDLGLIHSTNGNHLESPNEGSSIDHQVTIHLHAQNITMFPTNETLYFASQMLVSSSDGLILILTVQSTRNVFRIHSDY
ncbi:hypothetical protein F511_32640 [Dorcoceras hygrometricum]|uniref:Uncharacterized protein n=1 Tax=Dorcoceras hygrometricum TaxID=472368 RepID=A0A2Z7CD24_9LAMI|nr:hypothetical protein F511_32640 [Dorcoceras hygrometricum]